MDGNLGYLFAAFFLTWLVLGAYLFSLGRQVQALREEVEILTEEADQGRTQPPGNSLAGG